MAVAGWNGRTGVSAASPVTRMCSGKMGVHAEKGHFLDLCPAFVLVPDENSRSLMVFCVSKESLLETSGGRARRESNLQDVRICGTWGGRASSKKISL